MKNMAESMPKHQEHSEFDVTDAEIDQLMKGFEEIDQAAEAEAHAESIQSLAESLEKLGEELHAEQHPEELRLREFKQLLAQRLDQAVEEEITYLLESRVTIDGADMISVVIEHALDRGGVTKDASKAIVDRFMENEALRHGAKERLLEAIEAKMQDVGNDEEKISKLEKALDALESAS
jgi:uncharacterized protein YaaR (DUF327 family)